jgi:hypothetical protein
VGIYGYSNLLSVVKRDSKKRNLRPSFPDTIKIYTRAHGAKTTNLIINLDHPDWVLEEGEKTLQEVGLENEAELSLFHRQDYEDFIKNPETKW